MAPAIPVDFSGEIELKKSAPDFMTGKKRMLAKDNLSGFVLDYRHAVTALGELEGFGSSGRVDTEMTASEDSSAPDRKCINFNADGQEDICVPLQLLSLSNISCSERKELKLRLKMELDQVRALQRGVASLNLNTTGYSASSDIRSSSYGEKRLPQGSYQRFSAVSAQPGKKRVLPGSNEPCSKPGLSARHLPVKPAAPSSTLNAAFMKQCEKLLSRLMSHRHGWVFKFPVDPVALHLPDYFSVVKHPMDLGTVKRKLTSGEYTSPLGFAADVRLTFSNAMTYNPPANDVHLMAKSLGKIFEGGWKSVEKKLNITIDTQSVPALGVHVETEPATRMPALKKKKITSTVSNATSTVSNATLESVRRVMTDKEKHKLRAELEALLAELPDNIIDFLKQQSSSAGQACDDEIEIDIDVLGNDTLFQLRKLLDEFLLGKKKNGSKAEPCEIELVLEPGISNASILPCKGGDRVEEDIDVDIGENDPPIHCYPPVEIEKDMPQRNSKCSISTSISSQSDTDSGSSSDFESNGVKAVVPVNIPKDTVDSGANINQMKSGAGDPEIGNGMNDGMSQVEDNSQNELILAETDGLQEGESTPSERQVSPEKLYRAALLRNRFADTILKAREKTLEKSEKKDPEKLRMEREELERRQKEEKARLQAEAQAAEEARMKAEAEAAAEAKMRRELEREAARQALLQMEKTVDINSSSQFMEDLEMFRGAAADSVVVDERSPERILNDLGSFKLEGISNPLEQLGLYMKVDDEEEDEEARPENLPDSVNDVEEGEID